MADDELKVSLNNDNDNDDDRTDDRNLKGYRRRLHDDPSPLRALSGSSGFGLDADLLSPRGLVRDRNEEIDKLAGDDDKEEEVELAARFAARFTKKAERLKSSMETRELQTRMESIIDLNRLDELKRAIEEDGISPNFRLGGLKSLLSAASALGHLDLVKYLFQRGADIEAVDKHLKTPLMRAAETKHVRCVRFLVANGANILAEDVFGRTAFDLAVRSDSNSRKGDVLCFLAHQYAESNQAQLAEGLEKLFRMQTEQRHKSSVDRPDTLSDLAQVVVRRSQKPMEEALLYASRFKRLSEESLSFPDEYLAIARDFTQAAIKMMSSMRSDLTASWVLESSVLDVAIETGNNLGFFNSARVVRIMERFFEGDGWQYRLKYAKEASFGPLNPFFWLRKSWARFCVDALLYLIFCVLMSAHLLTRPGVGDKLWGEVSTELVLYVFVIGHVQREVVEFMDNAKWNLEHYLRDSWNLLDISIAVCFLCTLAMRLIYADSSSVSIGNEVAYRALLSVIAVLMWIRILFFVSLMSNVGPLLTTIKTMIRRDLVSFIWVMVAVLFGFSVAFHISAADTISEQPPLRLLFSAFLTFGGEGTVDTDGNVIEFEVLSKVLLVVYLLASSILLLNLLIALLSSSYEQIRQRSSDEFGLQRADIIWRYSKPGPLPPPLNLLVAVFNMILYGASFVVSLCVTTNPNLVPFCSHCGTKHDTAALQEAQGKTIDETLARIKKGDITQADVFDKEWIVQRYVQALADTNPQYSQYQNRLERYVRMRKQLVEDLKGDICQHCCRLLNHQSIVMGTWRRTTEAFVFSMFIWAPMVVILFPVTLYILWERLSYRKLFYEHNAHKRDVQQRGRRRAHELISQTEAQPQPRTNIESGAVLALRRSVASSSRMRARAPHLSVGIPQDVSMVFDQDLDLEMEEEKDLLKQIASRLERVELQLRQQQQRQQDERESSSMDRLAEHLSSSKE